MLQLRLVRRRRHQDIVMKDKASPIRGHFLLLSDTNEELPQNFSIHRCRLRIDEQEQLELRCALALRLCDTISRDQRHLEVLPRYQHHNYRGSIELQRLPFQRLREMASILHDTICLPRYNLDERLPRHGNDDQVLIGRQSNLVQQLYEATRPSLC